MYHWPSLLKISIYSAHHLHQVTTWSLLCNLCHVSVAVNRSRIRTGWWKKGLFSSTVNTAKIQVKWFTEWNFITRYHPEETNKAKPWSKQVLVKWTRAGWYTEGKRKVLSFHVMANLVCFSAISRLLMSCFHTKLCWWMCEGVIHGEVSACASFLKSGNPDESGFI